MSTLRQTADQIISASIQAVHSFHIGFQQTTLG